MLLLRPQLASWFLNCPQGLFGRHVVTCKRFYSQCLSSHFPLLNRLNVRNRRFNAGDMASNIMRSASSNQCVARALAPARFFQSSRSLNLHSQQRRYLWTQKPAWTYTRHIKRLMIDLYAQSRGIHELQCVNHTAQPWCERAGQCSTRCNYNLFVANASCFKVLPMAPSASSA